ncbi:Sensor histidine kinase RcsC [Usitatibacter rugosus]|uniref:histidine kinase n=2 Tax=Usitatibacter rugosus TaxID=2732067 RepID=A0A6M4GV54_9PROT|nr:Sensor histidine kinase RcsC [Usitatibacter rugosus]
MNRMEPMPQTLPRLKCLVVDDLDENLLALSALLRRDDVEVLTARSGPEALELLLAHDVALAFLDVQMPEMDGFELAELIRGSERTRDVPLIFVTAGGRDPYRLFKGYESGAVDFLYKPIDPFILRNKAEVFFDLHRQKQMLREEIRERTEALRFNEMFMAVLSHDLRNPLSALLNSAHLLQMGSKEPMVQETGARMVATGRRMGRMIEDLLDITRARLAGGIPVAPVATDLGAIVERVVHEQRALHPSRCIDVQRNADLSGRWDPERLSQVASNLIGNALQHGTAGEPVLVRLDGSDRSAVTLAVENAGAIDPTILPHVFDPFRGVQREAKRGDGLGLGLYIVREIVEAHGGTVTAQSNVERRTTFTALLPRTARRSSAT